MLKFKQILDFIKDYLAVFLIVPTVLGGLWQIIMLGSMSLTFIRFFSLSQIIQDGLLMLIFLIVLAFFSLIFLIQFYIMKAIGMDLDKFKNIRKLHIGIYRIKQFSWTTLVIILPLMILPVAVLWIYLVQIHHNNIPIKLEKPFPFFLIAGAISTVYFYFIEYINSWGNKGFRKSFEGVILSFSIIVIAIIFKTFTLFNKEYLIPSNLVNTDSIIKTILSKNPEAKAEIIYLNDKFIFLQVIKQEVPENKTDKINKIIILKFDDLLELEKDSTKKINPVTKIVYSLKNK